MSLQYHSSPTSKPLLPDDLEESQQNPGRFGATWFTDQHFAPTPASSTPPNSYHMTTESPQYRLLPAPDQPALSCYSGGPVLDDSVFASMLSIPPQLELSPSHLHLSDLETNHTDCGSWPFPVYYQSSYDMNPTNFTTLNPQTSSDYYTYSAADIDETGSPFSTNQYIENTPDQSPWFSPPSLSTSMAHSLPQDSRKREYEEDDDGEDTLGDRPYARLIYEALLQAPGHRMMLREIYEWFQRHTSKPKESSTNGWQNSIRHNLSMNKAFENDKSDSQIGTGQARKANSVWILTKDAIRNGVQSTTRYRKTGAGKKSSLNRTPAVLRQRSGAKGGRAARRAARLRRQEQTQSTAYVPATTSETTSSYSRHYPANRFHDYSAACSSSPPTPSEQFPFTPSSLEPDESPFTEPPIKVKSEFECAGRDQQPLQELHFQPAFEPAFGEILRLQAESRT